MRQADVDAIVQARARLVEQRDMTPTEAMSALKTAASAHGTTVVDAAKELLAG